MTKRKWTSDIRERAGIRGNVPVTVEIGCCEPTILGESGGFYTRGGTPISHPSAYSRKGWSNMIYRRSTLRISVGLAWLEENMPVTYRKYVDAETKGRLTVRCEYANIAERHIEALTTESLENPEKRTA